VDSQQIELIGRNLLVGELLRDGLEVAKPERDRGIDLIAYLDIDRAGNRFVAAPLQLKAYTSAGFGLDAKYEKFPELLLAYLWNVTTPTQLEIFCLTYAEALAIAEKKGWTKTASWSKGRYDNTRPGADLRRLLEPHRMHPGRWADKVRGSSPLP
jgi:hypothetical protein